MIITDKPFYDNIQLGYEIEDVQNEPVGRYADPSHGFRRS